MDRSQPPTEVEMDPNKPTDVTESGEAERPQLFRRRIDCGETPDVAERRTRGRPGRRQDDGAQR